MAFIINKKSITFETLKNPAKHIAFIDKIEY